MAIGPVGVRGRVDRCGEDGHGQGVGRAEAELGLSVAAPQVGVGFTVLRIIG
ncbi:MAG: hypothetical protein ACYDD6_06050 [Acidimicrobiales bacterium]